MFFNDDTPPHFHAEYGEHKASIAIETLEILEGTLPRRSLAMVLEWAAIHREELRADWALCRSRQAPRKIPPLE